MKNLGIDFKESFKYIKQTKALAMAAMLIALSIVLSFFDIYITQEIRISIRFIAYGLIAMLYGAPMATLCGGISDILCYIIKPAGAFHIGFTISAMLTGLILGLILYKKKPSLVRISIACSLVSVFINIFLTTYWLYLYYGKAMEILLPARAVKNLIALPIEIIVMYVSAKVVERITKKKNS